MYTLNNPKTDMKMDIYYVPMCVSHLCKGPVIYYQGGLAKSRGARKKVNRFRGGAHKKQNNPKGGPTKNITGF